MKFNLRVISSPLADSFAVMRGNKLATTAIVFFAALAFFSDALGILAVVPIMEAIQGQVVSEESNFVTRAFFTLIEEVGLSRSITSILIVAAIFFCFKALMKLLADYGIARVSVSYGTKLRYKMSKSLTKASGVFFKQSATGQFANAFNVEAAKSQGIFRYSVEIIFAFIHLLVLLSFAFWLSLAATGLFVVALFALSIISLPAYWLTKVAVDNQANAYTKIANQLVDWMNGVKAIKSMDLSKGVLGLLHSRFQQLHVHNVRQSLAKSLLRNITEMLTILAVVTVVIVNVEFFGKGIAEISGASLLFYRAMTVIAQMQGMVQSLISSHGFHVRIQERISQAEKNIEKFSGKEVVSCVEHLRFEEVGITFGNLKVLHNLSVDFRKGRLTVIVGP